MQSSKKFFNWAFNTRAENVIKLQKGEMTSPEKMFLSFCSHEPAFVSYGPSDFYRRTNILRKRWRFI